MGTHSPPDGTGQGVGDDAGPGEVGTAVETLGDGEVLGEGAGFPGPTV
ncbi:MAG: hypothetical protein J0I66_01505 [Microbacterium sp.]|nr:hypothetical protein [Microbacterium sp.]